MRRADSQVISSQAISDRRIMCLLGTRGGGRGRVQGRRTIVALILWLLGGA